MRLVDLDKVRELFRVAETCDKCQQSNIDCGSERASYYTPRDICGLLDETEEADVVQVVRCSECRYCFDEDRETPYDGESWWYCERWDKETNVHGTDPYRFFCADGESRDGETDA